MLTTNQALFILDFIQNIKELLELPAVKKYGQLNLTDVLNTNKLIDSFYLFPEVKLNIIQNKISNKWYEVDNKHICIYICSSNVSADYKLYNLYNNLCAECFIKHNYLEESVFTGKFIQKIVRISYCEDKTIFSVRDILLELFNIYNHYQLLG